MEELKSEGPQLIIDDSDVVVDTETLFVPQRLTNESFDDYKARRLVASKKVKEILKGKLFWDSRNMGTYKVQK